MARHIDGAQTLEEAGKGNYPTDVLDAAESSSRLIRRTNNGAIDVEYYEKRARRLRVRWMCCWLGRIVGHADRFWRRRKV